MRTRSGWSCWLLVCLMVWVAACETTEDKTPPSPTVPDQNQPLPGLATAPPTDTPAPVAPLTTPNPAVAGESTRTLPPIVSYTPRLTATLIPSETPTPTDTPTWTLTFTPTTPTPEPPTATLTPSPTVSGVIESVEPNVNLREGPGLEYDTVATLPNDTEVGVLEMRMVDHPTYAKWYRISYVNEDGTIEDRYWVWDRLVNTDFETVVVQAVPAEPGDTETITEPEETDQPGPVDTPVPGVSPTRTPGATPQPGGVRILAYCEQREVRPPNVTTEDEVYIEWSWFVSPGHPEYLDDHLQHANYTVNLDDQLLEDWGAYTSEVRRDPNNNWIIYWYFPVGQLSAGEHTVTYLLTWDAQIDDGYQQFGPGTPTEINEGSCTFTVTEP